MIDNKVKLIIWDLDDTFWRGSLEEGGIEAIPENITLVRDLAHRGIVSSICSKNNYERTRAKLLELEIWDHFVFPAVNFSPKGKQIAEMIEGAGLRAENVLFIDDNSMNLEEAKFFNPGIMAAHPDEVLHLLPHHPSLMGTPDRGLTRLNQYRFLQRKVEERKTTELSNEEFLRASDIRLTFDYDVAANFDRVVELINRTNQLNYTKKRLETPEELDEFRQQLEVFGYHAGCIRAADRYGDYGLVGFYLLRQRSSARRLFHFVFSCRAMHMGIEQYVYELLGCPKLDVVQPVAYGIDTHGTVDWIQAGRASCDAPLETPVGDRKLLLLGGCDLLQMTSYLSHDRLEFINRNEGKFRIRYDDPGFILSDRKVIRDNETIRKFSFWTYEDALRFDEGLVSSKLVVVSLWPGMSGGYYNVTGGLQIRMARPDATRICEQDRNWFKKNVRRVRVTDKERLDLVLRCLDRIGTLATAAVVFVIASGTKGATENRDCKVGRRNLYNEMCRAYCARHSGRFEYVDVDAIVPSGAVIGDHGHFTREGYFVLAQHILRVAGGHATRTYPAMNENLERAAAA